MQSVATSMTAPFLLTLRNVEMGIAKKGSARKRSAFHCTLAFMPVIFGPVVAMVSATSVAPLPLAIELGLKLHVLRFGRPEQDNVTVERKVPPVGTTWRTKPAACPGSIVCEVGVDVMEKLTELNVIAKVWETWFVSVPVATRLNE